MDNLSWFFFESTLALGGVLFVLLFVMLLIWRRGGRARTFLIGLGLAVVLLIVQAAVVTRREHAGWIMGRIAADVQASRTDAFEATLARGFRVPETGWDRDEFIEVVQSYMRWVDVHSVRRRRLEIVENQDEKFRVYVSYLAEASTKNYQYIGVSRWLIEFGRENDEWRITNIEPSEMDQKPVNGWRGLPRR